MSKTRTLLLAAAIAAGAFTGAAAQDLTLPLGITHNEASPPIDRDPPYASPYAPSYGRSFEGRSAYRRAPNRARTFDRGFAQ